MRKDAAEQRKAMLADQGCDQQSFAGMGVPACRSSLRTLA
jgi:hypothetical protein